MRVLVTGAAGGVGSEVSRQLACLGFELRLTDRRPGTNLPADVLTADLLDAAAVNHLVSGVDAVVHLGNHPNFQPGRHDPRQIFAENARINVNVFEAALDAGVRKIIFCSTIQVIHGYRVHPKGKPDPRPSALAYLPLDSDTPPNPRNPYSLSKLAAEQYLANWVAPRGVQCVSIRLPFSPGPDGWPLLRERWRAKQTHHYFIDEGFALLHTADTGRLVAATLRADLPGYRVYLPACYSLLENFTPAEAVERYYQGVPLRGDVTQMRSLVDISRITAETGWLPRYSLSDETYDPATLYVP